MICLLHRGYSIWSNYSFSRIKIRNFSSVFQFDSEFMKIHYLLTKAIWPATSGTFIFQPKFMSSSKVLQSLNKYLHMQEPSGTTANNLLCVQHTKIIDPFFLLLNFMEWWIMLCKEIGMSTENCSIRPCNQSVSKNSWYPQFQKEIQYTK